MAGEIPFVPSSTDKVSAMMKLAGIKVGQKTIDLGSGDGRIVIESAISGADAQGAEISEELISRSQENIRRAGIEHKATILAKSLWDIDFSNYDVITIYGMPNLMGPLKSKIIEEAKPGTKIISNTFKMPDWEPVQEKNNVYLYIK